MVKNSPLDKSNGSNLLSPQKNPTTKSVALYASSSSGTVYVLALGVFAKMNKRNCAKRNKNIRLINTSEPIKEHLDEVENVFGTGVNENKSDLNKNF